MIARAALDRASEIADENCVSFRFALDNGGYPFPYYPVFDEKTQTRFDELREKYDDDKLTHEEAEEFDSLSEINPPDDYENQNSGWWMPSRIC